MSRIDDALWWIGDRVNTARQALKYRTPNKAPSFVRAELESLGFTNLDQLFRNYDEEQLQRIAKAIPWIQSNVNRIAREVSTSPLQVIRRENKEEDIDHPFERLLDSPNHFFGGTALLQYTIWSMMFSEWGAFWFLFPDSRRPDIIREIWPVPINKLKPVKHKTRFISHYEYDRGAGKKPMRIEASHICRFFFPNPWDLWKSMTPLQAAKSSISLYEGISSSQSSLFREGRGIPLAIIGIDPNIGETDFTVVRQQIKEDWEGDKRMAVVRAGTIDVETLGISNRDMEVVASKEMNRDEIDSIYMGFPWRSDQYSGAEARKEVNREIKEHVIHPLHKLLASQMQVHIIDPFFGEEFQVGFDDVRKTETAIQLQRYNVTWRAQTLNESRKDLNKPAFEHELLPDLGDLPFPLAVDPTFVSGLYGMKFQEEFAPESDDALEQIGNISEAMSPEMASNLEARRGDREGPDPSLESKGVNIDKALKIAIKGELKKYRTICRRVTSRKSKPADEVEFDTEVIPDDIMQEIQEGLQGAETEDEVNEVFEEFI